MKAVFVLAAIVATLQSVAYAQTNGDDVRCLLLSVGYASAAKDANSRQVAAMTGAFYLGRVNSRLTADALAAAIRAQGKGLPAQQAEPIMRACAARAAAAQQELTSAAKQAGIGN